MTDEGVAMATPSFMMPGSPYAPARTGSPSSVVKAPRRRLGGVTHAFACALP